MFWCAIKDKELFFFSRNVIHIKLFCFLSLNHMCNCSYLLTYFALMKEKPCLWGTSVIEVLQRCSSYYQPMLNASYYQNSPPSSGLLTSFCKADNWLVSIAAADCHPLSLKLKVLLWCGGRACLAGERLLNGDSSVKWNMSEACENKVTLTLSEDHKKTQGHCSSDVDFKPKGKGHNYQNFSQPSG